jgi:quaternary ammonium compound-resistance protein SugE
MAWIILIVAGLFEIGWGTCLKSAAGFTRLWPTVGFVGFSIASLVLLGISLRTLPLGTAYAVWTGVGAAGMVIAGILLFNEPADWRRIACVALILAGIIGLRLVSEH